MMSCRCAGVAILVLALLTGGAAAQSATAVTPPPGTAPRESSWNSSRARRAIPLSLVLPDARSLPALAQAQPNGTRERRDSVWNGALIGGAIGAGGGYLWARNSCGTDDSECFAIAGPVGILGGIGIGLAVGAVADALHK